MEETKDPIIQLRSMVNDQEHLEQCESILEEQYDVNALKDRKKRLYIKMVLSQKYGDEWKNVYLFTNDTKPENYVRIVKYGFSTQILTKEVRGRRSKRPPDYPFNELLQLTIKLEERSAPLDFIVALVESITFLGDWLRVSRYLLGSDRLARALASPLEPHEIAERVRNELKNHGSNGRFQGNIFQ